jgi:hypothetical protein
MVSTLNDYKPETNSLPIDDYPSADNGKAIYRQITDASSSQAIQENLSRIVQRDIKNVTSKSRGHSLADPKPDQTKTTIIVLEELVDFITTGGSKAVEELFELLQRGTDNKEILHAFERAFTAARRTSLHFTAGGKDSQKERTESFIERARRLDEMGNTDAALDLLYDAVDDLMRSGKFSELNAIIANLSVNDCSLDVLLGVLTATLPARRRLPARAKFYEQAAQIIKSRGEYEDGLLTGLA